MAEHMDFDFAPLDAALAKATRAPKAPFTPDPANLAKVKAACIANGGIMSQRPYPTATEARKAGAVPLRYVELVAEELGKAVPVIRVIDANNAPATTTKTKVGENVTVIDSGTAPYRYVIRLANTRERKPKEAATPSK
jgi:hypothetical protein